MAKVAYVRQRNPVFDATFPRGNDVGPFQTFFTYTFESLISVSYFLNGDLNNVLNSIRYKRGLQLLIDQELTEPVLVMYNDLISRNLEHFHQLDDDEDNNSMPDLIPVRENVMLNTTTFNPEYFIRR
jgi:hypothetical protein